MATCISKSKFCLSHNHYLRSSFLTTAMQVSAFALSFPTPRSVRRLLTRVPTRTFLCILSSPGQVMLVNLKLGIESNLVHNKIDKASHHANNSQKKFLCLCSQDGMTFARQVLTKPSWRLFPLSNLSNHRVNTMVQVNYRSNRVRLLCCNQSTCALTSISVIRIPCRRCLMCK